MAGLWRTVRDLYKAVRFFGNEELNVLKREVLDLQSQVDKLKELRAKRVKYEEEMTLAQVRASVGRLMGQEAADEERQAAMRRALDMKEAELLGKLEAGMKGKMQNRVAAVMGDLDLDRLLHDPTIDVKQAVKDSIAKLDASDQPGPPHQADGPHDHPPSQDPSPMPQHPGKAPGSD
ncbi:hypothetical protein WJX74_002386 [Apatococcus lobatus]|uniref:Uncharacterized protein n=1 Tax=Apatococcus lobatus TaxID=904363 RepID=A0AAW1S307_9CHLO